MAVETVHCTGHSAAHADAVWGALAGFDVGWHPFVAWCEVESAEGQITRRFADTDGGMMHERLTYISHSARVMGYTMTQGIDGAHRYAARVTVSPAEQGANLTWHADIDAAPERAKTIAEGTAAVFEAGIAALNTPPATKPAPVKHAPSTTATLTLQGTPRLGLTRAPEGMTQADTLCICLHGIGGNRSNWDAQLTALGAQMPMVAMDLRGYGDSTLGFSQTQIDDYFEDISVVMQHFGATKVLLCGLSYGAWIAASFALRHPDMMAGLVLCGGCTGMSEAAPDEREAFRISRQVPLDAGQTPADFAPAVVDVIAGPSATAAMRKALQASMAAIPQNTYRDALNCFCNPLEKLDFAKATFPVLLMTGAHDRLAPPDEIRAVSHRFADAGAPFVGFEVIADAGHVCNLEQPEAVNAHLSRFMAMIAPATAPNGKAAKKSEKRNRIVQAALREFSKHGFSGASMAAIAKRAEVSKPTLYQYIGQKEDLFHAVLDEGQAIILAPLRDAHADLVTALWQFSWAYADYVLHPDNLSIARLIIGEAERVPGIAKQFHQTGPAKALHGIATYLEAQKNRGAITFADAEIAAEHLWSLILSGPRNHALHFPSQTPSHATLHRSITSGLEVFLKAYSTQPDADLQTLATRATQNKNGR